MRKIIILLIVFFFSVKSYCENKNFNKTNIVNDSLKSLLDFAENQKNDTTIIDILNKISWDYALTDQGLSIQYADSALKLAKNVGYQKGMAEAFNNLGEAFRSRGDSKQSLMYHQQALDIFSNLNDQSGIANTYSKIGITYFNISDFKVAIKNFNLALKIFREINDNYGVAKNLSYIAIVFSQFKEYQNALIHFQQAYELLTNIGDIQNSALQLGNIGITYTEMKEYGKALEYLNKAIEIFKEQKDFYNYSLHLGNQGIVYSKLQNYDKAENCFKDALEYAQKTDDIYGVAYQNGNLGRLFLEKGKNISDNAESNSSRNYLNKSITYLTDAVNVFERLDMKAERKNFLLSLSEAYKASGDYKNALEKYTIAKDIQDSLYNIDSKKMIAESEFKLELDIKKKEVEILNNEKEYKENLNKLLILIIVTAAILLFFILYYLIKKRKQNAVLHENIRIRETIEETLRKNEIELEKHKEHLEHLVDERTKDLEQEINERKKTEIELVAAKEKAESLNKAKLVFLANMSHELRTPLVGILGYSELLSSELSDPEFKEMALGINRTGNRLLNTLSMILDLARVESEKYEIKSEPVDIVKLISEISAEFKGALLKKNLKFNLDFHNDSIILYLDKEMFKVIIDNLLNNAIKFTSEGSISIRTEIVNEKDSSELLIKVIDTGIGMKQEDVHLCFEEFRQLSEGTTKDFPGTGLGLSITQKYTELLNGKIEVESIPDVGSTFILRFNYTSI